MKKEKMYWIVASALSYGLIVGIFIGIIGQPVECEMGEVYTWKVPYTADFTNNRLKHKITINYYKIKYIIKL